MSDKKKWIKYEDEILDIVSDNNALIVLMKSTVQHCNPTGSCQLSLETICSDTRLSMEESLTGLEWLIANRIIGVDKSEEDLPKTYALITTDIEFTNQEYA